MLTESGRVWGLFVCEGSTEVRRRFLLFFLIRRGFMGLCFGYSGVLGNRLGVRFLFFVVTGPRSLVFKSPYKDCEVGLG